MKTLSIRDSWLVLRFSYSFSLDLTMYGVLHHFVWERGFEECFENKTQGKGNSTKRSCNSKEEIASLIDYTWYAHILHLRS